jgi:hypothetical protein
VDICQYKRTCEEPACWGGHERERVKATLALHGGRSACYRRIVATPIVFLPDTSLEILAITTYVFVPIGELSYSPLLRVGDRFDLHEACWAETWQEESSIRPSLLQLITSHTALVI